MTAAPDSMSSGLQHGLRITATEVVFSTSGLRSLPHLDDALDLLLTGTGALEGSMLALRCGTFSLGWTDDRAHLP